MNLQKKKSQNSPNQLFDESPKNNNQALFSKKLIKKNKLIRSQISEESTLNTFSNTRKENNSSEFIQSNLVEKLNHNNVEIISNKISKAFNALEQLILDDCETNGEETLLRNSSSNMNSNKNSHEEIKIKEIDKLKYNIKRSCMSIPKLDFSKIFDYYSKNTFHIKEIKVEKENKILEKKHHHHKKSRQSIYKDIKK